MLKVLGRGTSGNVQKVIWLLEELKQVYSREDYGRLFNNTQTESYLKMNPNGKVPTLVDGDVVVWESNTILRYLCNKSAGGTPFYPAEPAARSEVERWMDWQLASFYAPYLAVFKDSKKTEEERGAGFAADVKELSAQLEILEKGTAGRAWLAGESLSLADFALGPLVDRTLGFPVTLPPLPGIRAWRTKIVGRPAYQKSKA
jgi:glutathione S-transferase